MRWPSLAHWRTHFLLFMKRVASTVPLPNNAAHRKTGSDDQRQDGSHRITANMHSGRIDPPGITIDVTVLNSGRGAMKLDASGSALAELDQQKISAKVRRKLDDSSFDATLGLPAMRRSPITSTSMSTSWRSTGIGQEIVQHVPSR